MSNPAFLAYTGQVLAPALERGDKVILDNLLAHEVAGMRNAITAEGVHLRVLLPYSHDLNAVENPFSKLKALLRRAAARTIPELWLVIADTLPQFASTECANYSAACGYEPE